MVLEHLNASIVRVDYVHAVAVVNEKTCGKAKLSEAGASLAEVVEQLAVAIENLHDSAYGFALINMSFGINSNPFRTEK